MMKRLSKLFIGAVFFGLLINVTGNVYSADIQRGKTFGSNDTVENTDLHSLVDDATITDIDQSDLATNYGVIYRSGTAPSDTDALWYDTGNQILKAYTGSEWQAAPAASPTFTTVNVASLIASSNVSSSGDISVTGTLKADIINVKEATATGNTNTTSSSYGDLDSMSVTFTPKDANNQILVLFSADGVHSGAGENISYILDIGGNIALTERTVTSPNVNKEYSVMFYYRTTLAASSQTVKVQWKTSASTATTRDRMLTVFEYKLN